MASRRDVDHVAAVFSHHRAAEEAVDELQALGVVGEHLGEAIRQPGSYVFEEDIEHDTAVSMAKGVLTGVPLGALAGAVLVGVGVPGMGVAVGGLAVAGVAVGALAGAYVGAFLGLATVESEIEDQLGWEDMWLQPGETLVVAQQHSGGSEAILARHGGRILSVPPGTT